MERPADVTSAPSLLNFRKQLKLHPFRLSYVPWHIFALVLHRPCGSSLLLWPPLSKPNCNLYIILYADDILLLAPSVTALENLLNDCERELRDLDMLINFKKSSCLRIGPRHDVSCASVVSLSGQMIPCVNEVRYLGIHIVSSRTFRCSLSMAKRSFFKAANAVLGKIGG